MINIRGRLDLLFRYLRNDRCKEYAYIIQTALEKGYQVVSVRDSIKLLENNCPKLMTLRHDVDHISSGTKAMFDIEQQYGVTASYYFRHSTFDISLIRAIEASGSEASLHYETIADYVKAWQIHTKAELEQTNYREDCLKLLQADLERFRILTGAPCLTIASHGKAINHDLETPNNILTEDSRVYAHLGIELEVYNKAYLEKYDDYISDTVMEINEGYHYGHSPLEAMPMGKQRIMFLSHPNHWQYDYKGQIRKSIKSVLKDPITVKEQFRRL
jgi:hypothetical protein